MKEGLYKLGVLKPLYACLNIYLERKSYTFDHKAHFWSNKCFRLVDPKTQTGSGSQCSGVNLRGKSLETMVFEEIENIEDNGR